MPFPRTTQTFRPIPNEGRVQGRFNRAPGDNFRDHHMRTPRAPMEWENGRDDRPANPTPDGDPSIPPGWDDDNLEEFYNNLCEDSHGWKLSDEL